MLKVIKLYSNFITKNVILTYVKNNKYKSIFLLIIVNWFNIIYSLDTTNNLFAIIEICSKNSSESHDFFIIKPYQKPEDDLPHYVLIPLVYIIIRIITFRGY